jgi:hypothetical protein
MGINIKNTKTQKHKNTKTQKHKNTKTQKHKNTKTQKHKKSIWLFFTVCPNINNYIYIK